MGMTPKTDIGAQNRNLVLAQILRQPPISRSAIGQALNLNAASVSRITRELIDARLVRESGLADAQGRPGAQVRGVDAQWRRRVCRRDRPQCLSPIRDACQSGKREDRRMGISPGTGP